MEVPIGCTLTTSSTIRPSTSPLLNTLLNTVHHPTYFICLFSDRSIIKSKHFNCNFQVYISILSLVAGKQFDIQQFIERPLISMFKRSKGKTFDALVTGEDRMKGLRWEKGWALFQGIFKTSHWTSTLSWYMHQIYISHSDPLTVPLRNQLHAQEWSSTMSFVSSKLMGKHYKKNAAKNQVDWWQFQFLLGSQDSSASYHAGNQKVIQMQIFLPSLRQRHLPMPVLRSTTDKIPWSEDMLHCKLSNPTGRIPICNHLINPN